MKIAVLGFGSRGRFYAQTFAQYGVETVAACDIDERRYAVARQTIGLGKNAFYTNEDVFFSQGKIADLLVVSTQDYDHYRHTVRALDLGYDILLEKPIACSVEQCKKIEQKAKETGRKVFVCHVLRYAKFFNTIKTLIDSGKYGKVVAVDQTENVGYWHQAHSFVRGNWRRADETNPMIVAKCCHDLDLISWFVDSDCESVSSFGELGFFTKNNAPEGSSDRCLDCKFADSCPYSAKKVYLTDRALKGSFCWPVDVLDFSGTVEGVERALKEGPYGRCVFKCDNDVVDRQVVDMKFKNGAVAHLTMTAFSEKMFRETHVHCSYGEIYGNTQDNKLYCNIFGKEQKIIDLNLQKDSAFGHGGGDINMVKEICDSVEGRKTRCLTSIEQSMQSHYIGFNAEKSRQNGGVLVSLKDD
ncbi:MAG: Gfo/Idh/MocA family oxidoreductase [Candidatus Borkfalkiaceae bacterium]|nr:Gfo/Idh/MocA family oxidoreductase [Christensenellaceae bacterium]